MRNIRRCVQIHPKWVELGTKIQMIIDGKV